MKKNINKGYALLALLLTASFLLAGCGNATPSPTPIDANAIKTSAASTALAQLTEIAMLTPTATNTSMPTATATMEPSPTVQPTSATVTPPTASVPTSSVGVTTGDKAEFISETIPDGTDFQPGATFTKTWTLKNIGTTTWTSASYAVVRVSGESITGSTTISLPKDVKPNESVDISVNLTAPTTTGTFTTYYMLRNAQSQLFGLGPKADGSFWVKIDVVSGGSTGATATQGSTSPTATQSSSGSGAVSSVSISLDNPSYSGTCPRDMVVTAQFNLSQASTVSYKLEAGSDSGYTFTLPPAVTSSFAAGTQTLVFYLTLSSSGSGWVKFHITSPVDISSSQANFTITCQ